jgi:lysophospholipase L1-like esterase
VARSEGVPWIALTGAEESRFRDPALFRDPAHLNRAGAALISGMLATRLAQVAPVSCP